MAGLSPFEWRRGLALPVTMVVALAGPVLGACGNVSASDDDGADGADGSGDPDGSPGSPVDASGPPIDAPISQPDAAPPQCMDGVTQLLLNPSFEQATPDGAIGWLEVAGAGDHLTFPQAQLGLEPQDGNRAAWLGRAEMVDQSLLQTVKVPPQTTLLRLSFYRCFTTLETQPKDFDALTVALLDLDGGTLEELAIFTNRMAGENCSWLQVTRQAAASHRDQDVVLSFRARTDNGLITSFFLDAVSLDAIGPCPE